MKRYHITFFLDTCGHITPTLSGVTVEAESIFFAIQKAINEHKIKEELIKYVIEL
jgi:hypothetical protein